MNTKLNKLRALGLSALALLTLPHPTLADSPQMFGVNFAGAETTPGWKRDPNPGVPDVYGTTWIYPGEADFAYYKSQGMELVRIPFRWERIQATIYGPLDDDELDRWDQVFALAEKHGMRVIPDLHNYGVRHLTTHYDTVTTNPEYEIGSASLPFSAFADVWSRLADEWKDRGCIWGYGLMNEPRNTANYSWRNAVQAAVDAIRLVDTKHAIIIPGNRGSSAFNWTTYSDDLYLVSDPSDNLIFEAHQYFDWQKNGQYNGTYQNDVVANGQDATRGVNLVSNFVDWCNTHDVRGYLGEYGTPTRKQDRDSWTQILANLMPYLQSNEISGTYWIGGPWSQTNVTSIDFMRNGEHAPQWSVLSSYVSGAGTNYLPRFTWFSEVLNVGEGGSYTYSFASPGHSCALTPSDTTTTAYSGTRTMRFNFNIGSGGYGGGGIHLVDNAFFPDSGRMNLPAYVARGHTLSFWAKGTAGSSLQITMGDNSPSITGAKFSTGTLSGTWTKFEVPLSSLLNASLTASTKPRRLLFDVFPRNGTTNDIYLDLITIGAPGSNTAPTVSVDTSTGASSYGVGQTVPLVATATDTGGSIDYVEFHSDNQRIGMDDTAPYQLNTSFAAAGTYAVTATTYDNFGVAAGSAVKTLTITAGAPAAPAGLVATPGNARVLLSWTATPGATSYNVKRATVSGGPYTTVNSPTTNSWTDTGRTNNTTYYYVVSAVNGVGQSANSTQVSATPQAISITKDNADASGVTYLPSVGDWTFSTSTPGAYAGNYRHDGNTSATILKSVTYTPTLTVAGNYRVYARWAAGANRASNARHDITHSGGTTQTTQNQTLNNNTWMLIGTFYFNAGTAGNVIIRNDGANNHVVADAVRFDLY